MRVSVRLLLVVALLVIFCSSRNALEVEEQAAEEDNLRFEREKWQEILSSGFPDDQQAIQLIRPGAGHDRLEVNEVELEKLSAIEEPVSLVAIVGPYHSGKSFLLNVLMNSSHGFPVGAKPDPETRGIWMRIMPKDKLRGADGSRVVLLDTEGFYGEGASRLYDARIFAVSTLISSHLIYNTLRTLGDAQSVSALADLSKQAQVFNLQNWLHTAHATTTEPATSMDIDPFLLLETLKFPPLTWVVQGFDMNVNPSSSPVNYLQKFIAAHAQAGDRTLDTLFTQGIDCHTLRTPTDFNALREQVGDEGLAADPELYETLHPSYRAELKQLRKSIFNNLKAKGDGNFTGGNLARLIPLLVHYVNEDFPLNADRKLRDVLADIITEGSFSGGVQYFQLSMDGFFSKSTKGRLAPPHKEDSDASLSALAASALTAEELERILTSAEKKAIDYCKRRCVGVPSTLVATTCDAQLGIKISRMKPQYREDNDRKVKEVLVQLGEGLSASAVNQIKDIELPTRDSDIQRQCARAVQNVSKRYDTLAGPHRSSHLYAEAKTKMQEIINTKCDRVLLLNKEKITEILNKAKDAYRKAYEASIREGEFTGHMAELQGKPLSIKKLADLNLSAVKAGQLAFANAAKAGALSWIGSGYDLYDLHNFQCSQWSMQRYQEIQKQNEDHIEAFCSKLEAELARRYKDESGRFSPFPDNDETITEKADDLGKKLMQEYMDAVKDFSSVPIVEENRKELAQTIEDARAHLLKKNTALMAAFCYDPLMDAYKELHMQDCESGNMWKSLSFWTPKCLWPGPRYMFGFKYSAYSVARKHLDLAEASKGEGPKGVVLSPATRNKVIQSWIEHDLASHANTVYFNFGVICACIGGIMGCIYLLLRLVMDGGSGNMYKGTEGVQWSSYSPTNRYSTDYKIPNIHRRF